MLPIKVVTCSYIVFPGGMAIFPTFDVNVFISKYKGIYSTYWCYLAHQLYFFADMQWSSCDKKDKYVPEVQQ